MRVPPSCGGADSLHYSHKKALAQPNSSQSTI
jgi:hypothetical protein